MKYFADCTTIEELKKAYKNLALKNHPDLGGSEKVMQEINDEYHSLLKTFAQNGKWADNRAFEGYDYSKDLFAEVIQKIISFNMDIEIIGTWIWCFNSYPYKEQLKELGFWFSKSKKAWVYNGEGKKMFRSSSSVQDLRDLHGSAKVREKESIKRIA